MLRLTSNKIFIKWGYLTMTGKKQFILCIVILCLAILCVFTIIGCNKTYSVSGQGTFTQNNNAAGTFTYNVTSNISTVKVYIKMKTSKGTLNWSVKDPQGNIRWQQNLDGTKNFNETKTFTPIKGLWVLQVSSQKAEGKYDIKLSNK